MDIYQNETLKQIQLLLEEKKWSLYKLSKESGIPYSSLNSMFHKNTQPSLSTLEKMCAGLGMSMSEFFEKYEKPLDRPYSEDELELLQLYRSLSEHDQELLMTYLKGFAKKAIE